MLFGVHQVFLHPVLVTRAWRRVHGRWPSGVAEWVAIVVHDWGYWGCADMDGPEGVKHPIKGAETAWKVLRFLRQDRMQQTRAALLVLGHSRSFSPDRLSMLNAPDKVSIIYEWKWFYLLRAKLSGELAEFVKRSNDQTGLNRTASEWFDTYKARTIKNESSMRKNYSTKSALSSLPSSAVTSTARSISRSNHDLTDNSKP